MKKIASSVFVAAFLLVMATGTSAQAVVSSAVSLNTAALKPTSLAIGASSPTIATYQAYLKTLGYYSGLATGILDSSTQAAIMSFQKTNGLTADGILGTNTEAKISQLALAKSAMTAVNTPILASAVSSGSNSPSSSLGPITIHTTPIQACIHSGPFMSAPFITVTSPNGGQTYTAGQQITVTWTSCNLPSGAVVRLLVTNFQTGVDTVLGTNIPNSGSTTVTIPASIVDGNEYKAQLLVYAGGGVYMYGGNTVYDDSDNYFTINTFSTVTVCPNGNTLASNCTVTPPAGSAIVTATTGICPNGDTVASNCTLPQSANTCSATISSNGTATAVANAAGGSSTNQTGSFNIPFSVTAVGCSEYIPATVVQLSNTSARSHVQYSINGSNTFYPSGATGAMTVVSGSNTPTANGNYEIPAGQTASFILTAAYSATSADSYRATLYDVPWSEIDVTQSSASSFTGNPATGFTSNLVPMTSAFSTPYIAMQ